LTKQKERKEQAQKPNLSTSTSPVTHNILQTLLAASKLSLPARSVARGAYRKCKIETAKKHKNV
jgi:hypothetical protein